MVPFLKKGYRVAGVDTSAQMLRLASQKLEEMDLRAELFKGRLQSFQLNRTFDAVLCLFSVIDYLTQKKDLLSALKNVTRHMKKTSLFIFDFWNEDAVTGYYSPRRKGVFNVGDKMLERRSVTTVHPSRHTCEVHYTCSLKQDGRLIQRDEEKHRLRYFTVDEMKDYLKMSGLKVLDMHPFLSSGGKIKRNTWDVTIVAQKA
jgi:SAM-dependent methyltransferase